MGMILLKHVEVVAPVRPDVKPVKWPKARPVKLKPGRYAARCLHTDADLGDCMIGPDARVVWNRRPARLLNKGYDPNEQRRPSGQSGGGQWAASSEWARTEKQDDFGRYFTYGDAVDPNGNWKRLKDLPDEAYVALYHATSRERAQSILKNGYHGQGSAFTDTPPDYVYLGGKEGLGVYVGYQGGDDPVLVVFRVRKGDLEPDSGSDWKSHVRVNRKDLKSHGIDHANPSVVDTYAEINQVRAHQSRARPIGFVDYRTDEFTPTPLAKSLLHKSLHPGERWITVHPNGRDQEGHPVLIKENPDGSHTVVGGAGGKLTGMRLQGIKSPEHYRKVATEQRQARAAEHAKKEAALRDHLGDQHYRELQDARQKAVETHKAAKQEAEQSLVDHIWKQQGWDETRKTIAPEKLEGLDARSRQKVEARYQRAVMARVNQVVHQTRAIVVQAHDDAAGLGIGDTDLGALLPPKQESNGRGYQEEIHRRAIEAGRSPDQTEAEASAQHAQEVQAQRSDQSWRGMLDRRDGDVDAALKARASVDRLHAGAQRAREQEKQVVQKLEAAGVRVRLDDLDIRPNVETVQDAAKILVADAQRRQIAEKADLSIREAKGEQDRQRLAAAGPVEMDPLDEPEILRRLEDDFDRDAQEGIRRGAARSFVGFANELEQQGSMRENLSVGHVAVFNEVASAIGLDTVDPVVADLLGPHGTAHLFANSMREQLGAEQYEATKDALREHHVREQVGIAQKAESLGRDLVARAEAIHVPDLPEGATVEDLLGAQQLNRERCDLTQQARRAVGTARGRLEAASALNAALEGSKARDVLANLGPLSAQDAFEHAKALGLTDPSVYGDHPSDAELIRKGQYTIHYDGENRILEVHPEGLKALQLAHDHDLEHRIQTVRDHQAGLHDEAGWLPGGFSRRPAVSFNPDGLDLQPADSTLAAAPGASQPELESALRDHVGRRFGAGETSRQIVSDIRSVGFRRDHGQQDNPAWRAAIDAVAPPLPREAKGAAERRAHLERTRESFEQFSQQVEGGDALSRQRLPETEQAADLVYQVVAREPALRHAFTETGNLDRQGRQAIRDFAYRNIFGLDRKSTEIIESLSDAQHRGLAHWEQLGQQGDHYAEIQRTLAEEATKNAGIFGAEESPLHSVDLNDQAAVLEVAKANPRGLGFNPEFRIGESGKPEEFFPQLDGPHAYERAVKRIKGALRGEYWKHCGETQGSEVTVHGTGVKQVKALADSRWDPESVNRSNERWNKFEGAMGHEVHAYAAVQDVMRGHLAGQFAAAYGRQTGHRLAASTTQVSHANLYREACLSPDDLAEQRKDRQSKITQARDRVGGRLKATGKGSGIEALEDAKEAQARDSLLGDQEATGLDHAHRVTLGAGVEGQLASLLPATNFRHPFKPKQALDMSGDERGIRRQRIIKTLASVNRMAAAASTGAGKTAMSIGAFLMAREAGTAQRGIFAVPSVVQGQFGGEFGAFVDPKVGLKVHAEPGAGAEERHAAYADPNTHAVVVTHQALRDDLVGALARHKFEGSGEKAEQWLHGASDQEAGDAIRDAAHHHGWRFGFGTYDEAHDLLNRQGKPDSLASKVLDAFSRDLPHFIYSSADPVKNDASECFDLLRKIAPKTFTPDKRRAWMRKYGRNTAESLGAMKRAMAPYCYPERVDSGVARHTHHVELPLSSEQQRDYKAVESHYRKAVSARSVGKVDVQAIRALHPDRFEGLGRKESKELAERYSRSLPILRDAALRRVVNQHPAGVKLKAAVDTIKQLQGKPAIIFAHNLAAVAQIAEGLKAQGVKCETLTGKHSSKQKDEIRDRFAGENPTSQVLVLSDAGAVGISLHRAATVINWDTPMTAKTYNQRIGRADRTGQTEDVHVHDFSTATPIERADRARLAGKGLMREELTRPDDLLDETDLANEIHAHVAAKMRGRLAA